MPLIAGAAETDVPIVLSNWRRRGENFGVVQRTAMRDFRSFAGRCYQNAALSLPILGHERIRAIGIYLGKRDMHR